MIKFLSLAGQAISHDGLLSYTYPKCSQFFQRSVSTNSAIHRGIRRSDREPYRGASHTDDVPSSQRGERISSSGRIPRPNHQGRQDVEDMRESEKLNQQRRTPEQRRYMRGGAPEPSERFERRSRAGTSSDRFSGSRFQRDGSYGGRNIRSSYQDSSYPSGDRADQPRAAARYKNTRSTSRPPSVSRVPNRAAQRASIYGHVENPPPGYKASNLRTSEQEAPAWDSRPRYNREVTTSQRSALAKSNGPKIEYHLTNGKPNQTTLSFNRDIPRYDDRERPSHNLAFGESPQRSNDREQRSYNREDRDWNNSRSIGRSAPQSESIDQSSYGRRSRTPETFEREPSRPSDRESSYSRDSQTSERSERSSARFEDRDGPRGKAEAPLSIPYTTPASEFLYGTSVITAALQSNRRKMYKLYLYNGDNREVATQDNAVRKLALERGVQVTRVQGEWLRLMDKMSGGRPHNGYILEASPLPKLPVVALQAILKQQAAFHISLDHQSREDEAVNGKHTNIQYQVGFPRYPFVLLLDGILDPGNLGAILRTAYFLGVDAVAISDRNSAPFTPVTLKASAGASENLPLLSVGHPANFIDECQNNGWKFYGAMAPNETGHDAKSFKRNSFTTATLDCPLRDHPCVLMLGGEGEGLRWNLLKKADYIMGIDGHRSRQGGVDSLNVSVAAGLLCDAFLRKPLGHVRSADKRRRRDVPSDDAIISDDSKTGDAVIREHIDSGTTNTDFSSDDLTDSDSSSNTSVGDDSRRKERLF